MHKFRSAAKREAWYDDPDGEPSWNPFGKIRSRYEESFEDADPVSEHSLAGEISRPTENVAESDVKLHGPAITVEIGNASSSGDIPPRRSASVKTSASSSIDTPEPKEETNYRYLFSARAWFTTSENSWYLSLRDTAQRQWQRLKGQSGPSPPVDVESSLSNSFLAPPLPKDGKRNHLYRKGRPRRTLVIDYGHEAGTAFTAPPVSREFKDMPRNSPMTQSKRSNIDPVEKTSLEALVPIERRFIQSLSETPAPTNALDLRVIYMQDDPQCFQRVTEKYGIEFPRHRSNFSKWAATEMQEAAPKVQTEQTVFWRRTPDRARGIVRTAFGMEYLTLENPWTAAASVTDGRKHAIKSIQDVYREKNKAAPQCCSQRLSVYVQLHKSRLSAVKPDLTDESSIFKRNTIVISDTAKGGIASEALVPNDRTWQDLSAYAELDEQPNDESHMEEQNVDEQQSDQSKGDKAAGSNLTEQQGQDNDLIIAALLIVFEAIGWKWNEYITNMSSYIVYLEEVIYGAPANDQLSPALWEVSKQLLQAERLLKFHILLLENVEIEVAAMLGLDLQNGNWLRQTLNDFRGLSSEVEETLKKPVAHMVDLMYKSISIRDARQSLELNTSLWRLSWITFIFLPLTFLSGFFGMNVDLFQNYPPLKWYFIVAAPFMTLVMISWLLARTLMGKSKLS